MRALLIALILYSVPHICPLLADVGMLAQAPKTAPRQTVPRHPLAGAVTDPDEGSVSDDTYTNRFFALQYTFPENLDVQDQAAFMEGQLDQSGRTFVLLAAWGATPDDKGREGVVIVADAISPQYGAIADGADYLHKVTGPMMQKQAFELTADATPVEIAGARFFRSDFHKKNDVYQSQIVTLRRGYALVFSLTGPTQDSINRLAASLQSLKLAPAPPAASRPRPAK